MKKKTDCDDDFESREYVRCDEGNLSDNRKEYDCSEVRGRFLFL